ncbi:MAG: hypothetical protein ACR2L6_02455 [Gemmatimonadaceae bacterium]
MTAPNDLPELAGISTYRDAAQVGYPVEENVRRLVRFQWAERSIARILVAHLPATPEWDVKCAFALHQWECVMRADALRTRIAEMRSPVPALDVPPDNALEAFFQELHRSNGTAELLAGVYGVALPALWASYRSHLDETNHLADHPTVPILRAAIPETESAIAWGDRCIAALRHDEPRSGALSEQWREHLVAYLLGARGIAGAGGHETEPSGLPAPHATGGVFVPSMHPRRDARFSGSYNFNFPPHVAYNAESVPDDERNLALLCKRTLEMDVPEMMASFLTERTDQPWEFYLEYSRQLWDEARHAMMGAVALQARGIDWRSIPLNIGFSLRLNLHATPLERQVILYGIEQSLMPADAGKRSEHATAVASGDALSAHFHDYDWADEVLHAQIGRRAMKREGISRDDALERANLIHEKTWAALDAYRERDPQAEWWPAFVRQALGRDSAVKDLTLGDPKVVSG